MSKSEVYQQELAKLTEIFAGVEESKRKLVEGLIEDAAFLRAENIALRESLAQTGMVKIHPDHPHLQKPLETSKQYLKNVNSYSGVVKALNSVLQKNIIDDEDELGEFE